MPNFSHVSLEKDASEHILWLTINRPQRRNAINDLTIRKLREAIVEVAADDEVRVVILTGADHREGTSAIRESRKPLYEGR